MAGGLAGLLAGTVDGLGAMTDRSALVVVLGAIGLHAALGLLLGWVVGLVRPLLPSSLAPIDFVRRAWRRLLPGDDEA